MKVMLKEEIQGSSVSDEFREKVKDSPREYITISQGMRGWFAVMMWFNPEGFWEPWNSSPLSFRTRDEAVHDGKNWADEEGVSFHE